MNWKIMVPKPVKNWLIYVTIKFFVWLIQSIPRSWAFAILKSLAWFSYYLIADARKKTLKHLKIAFGGEKKDTEIEQIAKQVFINLGRNAVDVIRLKKLVRDDNIDRYVASQGLKRMDKALARRKGVLAITGHIGSWEMLAAYFSLKGYPVSVVGTPLYDPRLDAMLVENRQAVGLKNIARGSATRQIIQTLKKGEIIGILIDQDTKVDGVFVDFFGQKAFTPLGPVLLAMKTGAALLPLAIHIRDDNTHLVQVQEEIKLQTTGDLETDKVVNTERCSKAIEKFIRQNPTQWVWMHERWKTKQARNEK